MTAHEWLQDALGRYQVTHIHSSIRNALKAMNLTEAAPLDLEVRTRDIPRDKGWELPGVLVRPDGGPLLHQVGGEEARHCPKCHRLLDPNGLCPYCLDTDECCGKESDLAQERSAPSYLIEGMSREKLVALCIRWEKAHCEAGLIGSEYYADPERVFQRVRDQRDSLHRGLMRAIQREKAAGCLTRGTARCNRA